MKDIWQKIQMGHSLSLKEMNHAIDTLTVTKRTLEDLGPDFRLAVKEINENLRSIESARQSNVNLALRNHQK